MSGTTSGFCILTSVVFYKAAHGPGSWDHSHPCSHPADGSLRPTRPAPNPTVSAAAAGSAAAPVFALQSSPWMCGQETHGTTGQEHAGWRAPLSFNPGFAKREFKKLEVNFPREWVQKCTANGAVSVCSEEGTAKWFSSLRSPLVTDTTPHPRYLVLNGDCRHRNERW